MAEFRVETARLALRQWRESDLEAFAQINADPEVMTYIGPALSREQTDAFVARHQAMQAALGHCYWAIERQADAVLIGFCGLEPGPRGTPVEGRIEIGWRLAREAWGKGLAEEAAKASMQWGFDNLPVEDIWSKTVPANERSLLLMRRIGMAYVDGGDFDHPALPEGHALRRHVLYRISRPQ